jgi:hypothetical protein
MGLFRSKTETDAEAEIVAAIARSLRLISATRPAIGFIRQPS